MEKIADYSGMLLNHFEAVFRPGERALALEFSRALGLQADEMRFTEKSNPLVAVHPNADDRDATNNVFYLHEMQPSQAKLDTLLREKIASDPELGQAMDEFRETVRTRSGGTPHFGIRYRSQDVLDNAVERLKAGSPELASRVEVKEMPRYEPLPGLPDIRQVFVFTDIITASPGAYGQLIELQCERS